MYRQRVDHRHLSVAPSAGCDRTSSLSVEDDRRIHEQFTRVFEYTHSFRDWSAELQRLRTRLLNASRRPPPAGSVPSTLPDRPFAWGAERQTRHAVPSWLESARYLYQQTLNCLPQLASADAERVTFGQSQVYRFDDPKVSEWIRGCQRGDHVSACDLPDRTFAQCLSTAARCCD